MAELLISLLIVLLVLGVIWLIGTIILQQIPSPIPLATIWDVVCMVIMLIVLLNKLMPLAGMRGL